MRKTLQFALLFIILLSFHKTFADDSEFGIKLGGFVKTDIIYDSRQTESPEAIREGHFLILPKPESLNLKGDDVNKVPSLKMMSIQTRFSGKITAPDALGAKSSGYIEAEFFGTGDPEMNGFRLRHAYLQLEWQTSYLRVGQWWHPMFIDDCFPNVVSFNTGAPFQPFSRNPQIRFTQKFSNIHLQIAACSQRDFKSMGPDATPSNTKYLSNAILPDLNLQVAWRTPEFLIGAGGEYKMLKPRIKNTLSDKVDNTIGSFAAMGYIKYISGLFSIKAEGIYGQNLTDLTMIGGYSAKEGSVYRHSQDPFTGMPDADKIEYTPSNTINAWTDLAYGKDVEVGLFAGYAKNLGTTENLINGQDLTFTSYLYGRGMNVDNVLRVSPRIICNFGKVRFSGELEYTSAAYGKINPLDNAKVVDSKDIANIRLLLAAYIFF